VGEPGKVPEDCPGVMAKFAVGITRTRPPVRPRMVMRYEMGPRSRLSRCGCARLAQEGRALGEFLAYPLMRPINSRLIAIHSGISRNYLESRSDRTGLRHQNNLAVQKDSHDGGRGDAAAASDAAADSDDKHPPPHDRRHPRNTRLGMPE